MRIGMLTYALDRPLTGIGRYTVELTRALAGLENAPEIILLTAGGTGSLAELGLQTVALRGCEKLPGLMTLGNAVLRSLSTRLHLDVLHDPIGITPLALGTGQASSVVTIHDVIPWSYPGVSTRLDTLIYRRWLPVVLPRVDAVVTVSEVSKVDIARYLKIPAAKIHNTSEGVNPHYRPATPQQIEAVRAKYGLDPEYILFVGNVEERKNLTRVLQAYAVLRGRGCQQQLALVGPQKWKYEHIMQALDELQLGDHVVFTGYVPEADLPVLYSGAGVFVYPSLYEGFGLPVLEAMACGAAVVTSTFASLVEIVQPDAALTVDPYNVEAIADALEKVLGDPQLRSELQQKALARAAMFSWANTAQATLNVYEQLRSEQFRRR